MTAESLTSTQADHAKPSPLGTDRLRGIVELRFPVVVYLVSRVSVLISALAATWLERQLSVAQVLSAWDGGWYLAIAEHGYPDTLVAEGGGNRWAFFPAFPAIVRGVVEVTPLGYVEAAVAVNLLAGLVLVIAVWKWTTLYFDRDVANGTVGLLCFFPTAYTLSMAYTEALMIALAAVALLAMARRKWLTAAMVTGLAGATRSTGIVLLASLAVAVIDNRRAMRRRDWLALLPAVVGLAVWLAYQHARTGYWTAFSKAQEAWGYEFRWFTTPFRSVARLLEDRAAWHVAPDVLAGLALIFVVGALVAARHHLRTLPVEAWVYTIGSILLAFSAFWATSILRYVLAIFPLFALLVQRIPKDYRFPLIAGFAVLQGTLGTVAFASITDWTNAPFAP